MKSLDKIIHEMTNTRDISRIHANSATQQGIKDLASTYADLFSGYITDLEEANRMIDLQINIAKKEFSQNDSTRSN